MQQSTDFSIGIDIGSVSIKLALFASASNIDILKSLFQRNKALFAYFDKLGSPNDEEYYFILSKYKRTKGEPIYHAHQFLKQVLADLPPGKRLNIAVTGSAGRGVADLFNFKFLNEFQVLAHGIGALHPEVNTIMEIGGDSSKYLKLNSASITDAVGILDYEMNGECAAGTGSFLDQQASRLLYNIEDVGDVVCGVNCAASIAGRCSVFAKSDMIHAQQKGFQPGEILKGLCEAVVRNYKGAIVKSKDIVPPVAFIGGVAANKGIKLAIEKVFQLNDGDLIIPEYFYWMEAIGCGLQAIRDNSSLTVDNTYEAVSGNIEVRKTFETTEPIATDKLVLLRDQVQARILANAGKTACYLGLDIGSVSTKLVVINTNGDLVKEIYSRTDARPIEVVGKGLAEIEQEIGEHIEIIGVGTTGSGRELIGELIGADSVKDEITAHKTGAMYIGEKLTGRIVDTIFDIGGQDSKFIALENGIVVDFTMNEACAAGTGSFLEEQAEKLGISIKDEFSQLALSSQHPVRLGERCTVFMEKDITPFLQQGAKKEDIVAGLAFSIVYNYLNRVVRGRKIGDTIYFQGGTAYNDSVAAAFATVLDKNVIVPPYNGVIGAIGAALLAKDKIERTGQKTIFRGFDISRIRYSLRNFTCKGCTNFCDIQQFTVEGKHTYWGDKCAEKYRNAVKSEKQPVIPDLLKWRNQLLVGDYNSDQQKGTLRIGYPRSLYFYEQYPFWKGYFDGLGVSFIISDETNKQIIHAATESKIAEPCFPVEVGHGHVQDLIDKGVDYIFQPNVINAETAFPEQNSFLCPWGQTLCLVLRQTPAFKAYKDRILFPNIRFAEGEIQVKKELGAMARQLGFSKKKSDKAVDSAYLAQRLFRQRLIEKGREALEIIRASHEKVIIIVGRPYNIYDKMINLNVPQKLRDYYGVNVIPLDFLDIDTLDINDVLDHMYWNYGRKILQAAKFCGEHPNFHLIYITNFKCGPDSYVKHYVRDAVKNPYLIIQFDGHGNDAGIITRCEAYLDSKGFFL